MKKKSLILSLLLPKKKKKKKWQDLVTNSAESMKRKRGYNNSGLSAVGRKGLGILSTRTADLSGAWWLLWEDGLVFTIDSKK